jgi:DNA repair protein RadC
MENIEQPKKTNQKTPCEFKVMRVRECLPSPSLVDTPELAAEYWKHNIPSADWFDPCKEAFIVLVLNTRRRILGHNLVSLGSLDTCFVHAREVFRPVIVAAGCAIILMHNHPSGDPTPSETDIKVTRDLIRAGQLLKIEVVDHVIVGQPRENVVKPYVSLRELGYFAG